MKALTLLLILGLTVPVLAQPIEWPISEGGNGHYYEWLELPEPLSWHLAHQYCQNLVHNGLIAHLVTITSAEEDLWIVSNLLETEDNRYVGWHYPLGGYDAAGFGGSGWQWITGETWDYQNWAHNEPNDPNEGTSPYLSYLFRYEWNDVVRTGFNDTRSSVWPSYIIEYDDLTVSNLPVAVESSNWGSVKALYR